MILRRTGPLLFALPLLAALAPADLGAQGVSRQGHKTAANKGTSAGQSMTPFALPSQITFQHIKDAMERRTYDIRQVRRTSEQLPLWQRSTLPTAPPVVGSSGTTETTRWIGTKEALLHQEAGSNTAERFQLTFLGIEGKQPTPYELIQRKKTFAGTAGFLFRYQSFRVHDVTQANQNYIIYYLGKTQRIGRATYRVAVLPKRWDRSAWLLDLDIATGYPLYRAEYTLDIVLRAEVEVTSFQPNVRVPNGLTSWWTPTNGVVEYTDAAKALSQVLPKLSVQVVPGATQLPAGYKLARSRVVTDAYQGTKKAALIYSDGIDQMFVLQVPKPQVRNLSVRTVGDNLYVFENNGITDFYFSHRGVDFRVIGGASRSMVETTAKAIYRQAVATLR
jgi:hypothetical protein